MYFKLGKTKINYSVQDHDDFMIYAEVVDSGMSYEKPVLVRTAEELDLWFGTDFEERDFFIELLSQGITLYLCGPLSEKPDKSFPDYIDYSEYEDILGEYFYQVTLPERGESEKIYKTIGDSGSYITDEGQYYDKYIWIDNSYVNINDLPQNLDNINSDSCNNRDTLRICYKGSSIPYVNSIYGRTENLSLNVDLTDLDLDKIDKQYQTLAFKISYSTLTLRNGYFIILPTSKTENTLFYYGEKPKEIEKKYYQNEVSFNSTANLFQLLEDSYGYTLVGDILYTPFPVQPTYFYDLGSDFSMEPNIRATRQVLDEKTTNDARIEFWSKTIGTCDEADISVGIDRIGNDEYRITISRFSTTEVYEGTLTNGEERLDYKINQESSIVRCRIVESYEGIWKNTKTEREEIFTTYYKNESNIPYHEQINKRDSALPEGVWIMKGAKKEEGNSYLKPLEIMLKDGSVSPDYFLIPDIEKYGKDIKKDWEYYQVYDTILNYAKEYCFQALIQNTKETYRHNYLKDSYNYLVYFYGDIWVSKGGSEYKRPGYYLFLLGLSNRMYQYSSSQFRYNSENVPSDLEKYKSNFLVDSGMYYYYSRFEGDQDSTMTTWMRFAVGKVKRELEKNKWSYLGQRMYGSQKNTIETILGSIKASFDIIYSLTLDSFEISDNTITVSISTTIDDLVENSITVDLILNYNK